MVHSAVARPRPTFKRTPPNISDKRSRKSLTRRTSLNNVRRAPVLALTLLAILMAGCAERESNEANTTSPSSTTHPPTVATATPPPVAECKTPLAAGPSGNAPLAALLDDDPAAVAGRLAQAIGVSLIGAPVERSGDERLWRVSNGTLAHWRQPDGDVWLQWLGNQGVDDARGRAWLDAAQENFNLSHVVNEVDNEVLVLQQQHNGHRIEGASARLALRPHAAFSFGPFYDIAENITELPESRLADAAREYGDCARAQRSETAITTVDAADYSVRTGSLARVLLARFEQPDPYCSNALGAHVDVVTAAVLDETPMTCQ